MDARRYQSNQLLVEPGSIWRIYVVDRDGFETEIGPIYTATHHMRQFVFVEREITPAEQNFIDAVQDAGWRRAKVAFSEWKTSGGRARRAAALEMFATLDGHVAMAAAVLEVAVGAERAAFTVSELKDEITSCYEQLKKAPDFGPFGTTPIHSSVLFPGIRVYLLPGPKFQVPASGCCCSGHIPLSWATEPGSDLLHEFAAAVAVHDSGAAVRNVQMAMDGGARQTQGGAASSDHVSTALACAVMGILVGNGIFILKGHRYICSQECIPYQLQLLFCRLQTIDSRDIETTELTKSFGWTGDPGVERSTSSHCCLG